MTATQDVTLWCDVEGCHEWTNGPTSDHRPARVRKACREKEGWRVTGSGLSMRDVCWRHKGPISELSLDGER